MFDGRTLQSIPARSIAIALVALLYCALIVAQTKKEPISMETLRLSAEQVAGTTERIAVLERIRREFSKYGQPDISTEADSERRELHALYDSVMRSLFTLYLRTDSAKALELAEEMNRLNPDDKSWTTSVYLQRLLVRGWPDDKIPDQLLEQTRIQLELLTAERHDLTSFETENYYWQIARHLSESPIQPLFAAQNKLGKFLTKSPKQIERDRNQILIGNAVKLKDFELNKFDGSTIRSIDLRGKVVFISFWAPSCPGCVKELKYLQRLQERYKERSERFLLLVVNTNPEQNARAEELLKKSSYSFTSLRVPRHGWAREVLGVEFQPANYILDSEGRAIYHSFYLGNAEEFETTVNKIDRLLKPSVQARNVP